MKKKFFLFLVIFICLHFHSCTNKKETSPVLAVCASGQELSDSLEFLSFGFNLIGDSVVFNDMNEMLPVLQNTTSLSSEKFALFVAIKCSFKVDLSMYYVVDEIVEKEEEGYKYNIYYIHYNHYKLDPYEKVPFPITKISSIKDDNVMCVMNYTYFMGDNEDKRGLTNVLIGFHRMCDNSKLAPKEPQYSFMAISRPYLNYYNPRYMSFIYKDTIIPSITNIDPLRGKNISIHKLIELQE